MNIPFAEFCVTCCLGNGRVFYNTFHEASREQITSLVRHMEALDARNLYVHRLNLHWFGTHGIGEILDY